MSEKGTVLAVDCGGTFLKSALVDQDGNISEKTSTSTKLELSSFVDTFSHLITQYHSRISSVGIAFAGPVSAQTGLIGEPPNFPKEFHHLALVEILSQRCNIPVVLENDANLAALGEYWKGAKGNDPILLVITLGTGVGSGIILHGKIWNGATGIAGEVGHIPIAETGIICGCGNSGCLETMASSTAVVRMAKESAQKNPSSSLAQIKELTAKDVFDCACNGDEASRKIFEQVGTSLGKGIATIVHILGVGKVIITGGGIGAWQFFAPTMEIVCRKMLFQQERNVLQIVPSSLEGNSGILGAAYLAWERLGKTPIR